MAESTMIIGASQLCSFNTRPSNSFVGWSSLFRLRRNSAPNLIYKRNKSYLTAHAVEVADENNSSSSVWGHASICGEKQRQGDVVVAIHEFLKASTSPYLTHLSEAPFFGVYDWHGAGPEAAEYCRDRLHSALAKELEKNVGMYRRFLRMIRYEKLDDEPISVDEWRESLTSCFRVVDAEFYDKTKGEPCLSGSTAVVAIVCSSYIVVANCGDSRAVLKRGQESVPLCVDYKAGLGDEEYARIRAGGGKIRKWYPGRSGRYASDPYFIAAYHKRYSRAIGDGHWKYDKSSVKNVPDPEVTVFPRTEGDRCLVIASEGLWDVMTNEEACDIADQMIHSSSSSSAAPRAAAEYLSSLAFGKAEGSRDKICVLVVDLETMPRDDSLRFPSTTIVCNH